MNIKIGSLYKCRFRDEYVLVIKKFKNNKINLEPAYYVLLSDGSLDMLPLTLLKSV